MTLKGGDGLEQRFEHVVTKILSLQDKNAWMPHSSQQ